jgi:hypothetical protein
MGDIEKRSEISIRFGCDRRNGANNCILAYCGPLIAGPVDARKGTETAGAARNMTIVTGANAARQSIERTTSFAPCTKDQFEQWTRAEDTEKGACKRVLAANYAPYVDISPVQLPSGDIITPLSGPAQGYLAVLNPVGLTEKHRLKLARCP